jgi:ubiquitin C-terminal hydrolase
MSMLSSKENPEQPCSLALFLLGQPDAVRLEDLLVDYTSPHDLEDSDKWRCEDCRNEEVGAVKSVHLMHVPPVLILHLGRFRYDGGKQLPLGTRVTFPDTLTLTSDVLEVPDGVSVAYKLRSFIDHFPNGVGHLVCWIRSGSDWYRCDDRVIGREDGLRFPKTSRRVYLVVYEQIGDKLVPRAGALLTPRFWA